MSKSHGSLTLKLLVLAAALLALAGCQRALDVGAVNSCGHPIEVKMDSVPESSTKWVSLGESQRRYVVSVPESAQRLYVLVRYPGAEQPKRSEIDLAELVQSPTDAGYESRVDREIVLDGDRCPAVSDALRT